MAQPSTLDVAWEANTMLAGLTILTIQIFPFALPLLVLTFAPLVVLAVAAALIAAPFVLPVLLVRWLWRRTGSRQRDPVNHHVDHPL